jgi:hypothetical protein
MGDADVPTEIVARLCAICLGLPEAYEEVAWTGVRWRVRGRTFAHVLTIADGWPPAYARAAGTDGPCCVLMFRAAGDELDALRHGGAPFFAPPWRSDEVGMVVAGPVDDDELRELLTESYRALAPPRLRPP